MVEGKWVTSVDPFYLARAIMMQNRADAFRFSVIQTWIVQRGCRNDVE